MKYHIEALIPSTNNWRILKDTYKENPNTVLEIARYLKSRFQVASLRVVGTNSEGKQEIIENFP